MGRRSWEVAAEPAAGRPRQDLKKKKHAAPLNHNNKPPPGRAGGARSRSALRCGRRRAAIEPHRPDSPLCRAVLSSLCRCAPARDAAAFLDDMRRWGVSPSGLDHCAVLHALLRDGMVAEAYRVVKEKMKSDGVAPGVADFGLMLRAFSELGQFDAVDEAFDEMLLRGLMPGVAVYNVYVAALCKKGDLPGARTMVECMERAGCPPDVRTFGVVVTGCVSAGDVAAAREVA